MTAMLRRLSTLLALAAIVAGCPRAGQVRPAFSALDLGPEETLRRLAATDARAQRDLGLHLLFVSGDAASAERELETATVRAPDDPLAWFALAVLRLEHGRPTEGMAAAGRALEAALAAREAPAWCVAPAAEPPATADDCRHLAAALEETAATFLREADYDGRTALAEGLLERHGAAMGFAAFHNLHRALERDARIAGRGDEAARQLEAMGAILRWRAIGPFGPFPNESFDAEHQPERDARLAERYDLGPGRGELAVWEPLHSAGTVQLASSIGQSGTWYAEAVVRPARSGPVDVRLWSPPGSAASVAIGGVEVLRRDDRVRFEPQIAFGQVELEAGRPVRVLVKLSSPDADPGFGLALRDAAGEIVATEDPARAYELGRGREVEGRVDLLEVLALPDDAPISPVRAFVTAFVAQDRAFWALSEEALWRVAGERPAPFILLLRAIASRATPATSQRAADDRSLATMRQAFAADPALWRARMVVARQLAAEDQTREALDLVREGLELQPDNAALWHELGVTARRIGLHTVARQAFETAVEHDPNSCGSLHALTSMYAEEGLTRQRDETLERLMACDATSRARAQVLNNAGQPGEALEEALRLQSIDGFPAGLDAEIADLATAAGQTERAREALERLRSRWPRAASHEGALADLDGAAAGPEAAARRLLEAAGRYPWEMGDLPRVAGVLGARREFEPWRVDGLRAIEAFERSGATYDAPSVYVLDRAVYRVYPDRSIVEVVHQIAKVLTQEAVRDLSAFDPPRGGEVLTLRTIKPDGTVIEPLSYDPEATVNLNDVGVGDYVEWEYVVARGPSRVYPGGLQAPRFYFATPNKAMHLSELIVLLPQGLEVDFVPRGPNPPRPEPVTLGGLRGVRFAAQRVPSQVLEPSSPSSNEVFSSIGMVIGEDARTAAASWSDDLEPALRASWRMRRLVRDLRRPAQTEVELARAIYDYVLEHVRHGRSGNPAYATFDAGEGDALLLYAALLRVAGFEPEIVFAWTLGADRSGPYLMPGELEASLLRVELDGEQRWIVLGSRFSPFGALPAAILGQPGLVAGADPVEVRLPERPPIDDASTVTIDGVVAPDGTVAFDITERFTGARAAELRGEVSRMPEAQREQQAASVLGYQYAGAIAAEPRFVGVDDRHAPMELAARVASRMVVRREGERALMIPAHLSASSRYSALARLSARRTTLVFDESIREVVHQTLRLPQGATVERLCPAAEQRLGTASFEVRCTADGGVLRHRLEITIPPQRITPQQYADFAAFIRAYDEAAGHETVIRLR